MMIDDYDDDDDDDDDELEKIWKEVVINSSRY
jgi:hypothetical protein